MSTEFHNRVALVTSGDDGTGRATVTGWATAGAGVVVADVNLTGVFTGPKHELAQVLAAGSTVNVDGGNLAR